MYRRFLSEISKRRKPSAIRSLIPLMSKPGMISLGSGAPNPKLFPFTGLRFDIRRPGSDGKESSTIELSESELNEALQYSPSPGIPALQAELMDLQCRDHGRENDGSWKIVVSNGSQDSLTRAFEMFINPDDPVIVEQPTYSGSLAFLSPLTKNLIGITTDEYGIVPSALEAQMKSYDDFFSENHRQKKPRVLYCIPTGQNPGGSTMSLERKREIYALCCEHDLLIMEDDPYYFLYYGASKHNEPSTAHRRDMSSFFGMDTEDRVLRFDSASKILSSGLRIGWVTGPSKLIEQLELHVQATTLHCSGVSQVMAAKMFETWGAEGFEAHVANVAGFYQERRDAFIELCNKHLAGLAEWVVPEAGMFAWLKIPGITDAKDMIEREAVKANVLLVPGQAFDPLDRPNNYVRASFSLVSRSFMNEGLKRLAALIRQQQSKEQE